MKDTIGRIQSEAPLQTREGLRTTGITQEEIDAAIAALKPAKLRWYAGVALVVAALFAGAAWIIQGRQR